MSSFEWKNIIEDFIKDGMIITAKTTGIFLALKTENLKPPKSSMDATDVINLAGGINGGVLVKDYESTKNGSTSDSTKTLWPLRALKLLFNG